MFSRDAELVMDEGNRHGREDIRSRMAAAGERMAKAAAGKPVRQNADLLSNVEVRVRGDMASASSRFTFLAENDANQFVVRGSGLYLDTWVREDGEWLIKRRKVVWDLLAGATPPPASGGRQP
jgi:3-phenylpropionate/cinnamic acid dioxygenase small subunit